MRNECLVGSLGLFLVIFIFQLCWVFVVVHGLLTAVASLVTEHGLSSPQASGVAAHGLSRYGSWAPEHRFSSCGTQI